MTYKTFTERLQSETIYLNNEFEHALIKSIPGQGCWIKFPGIIPEFKAASDNGIVAEALIVRKEITMEEYDKS
jgi:hypothetical protein